MILCVPDNKKACAACCGLINHYDISRQNLTKFLSDGKFRLENAWRYQIEGCYPEQSCDCRDYSTHMCPFVGFLSPGSPGCLIHPLYTGEEKRDMSLYGARTCDSFSCPAIKIFSDEQKEIIIAEIDDWYNYTIAIVDPLSTIKMIDYLIEGGCKPGDKDFAVNLNRLVNIHSKELNEYKETIFCYSIDEYNLAHERFAFNIKT